MSKPLVRTLVSFSSACALLVLAGVWGCGRHEDAPSASTGPVPASASPIKVALVASGATSDNGWNAGAAAALKDVQSALKLSNNDIAMVDRQSSKGDQEKSLRAFAQKKYRIVFAHGAEYEDAALRMEGDFPDTLFVVSSGRKTGKNTTPIVIQLEDGAYLQGMLAAAVSKTNKIGSVGAEEIVPLKSIFHAFELGAKAIKPNIVVIKPTYTGDWEAVNAAKQQTLALLDQGADVIMQDLDAGAQGVFNVVQERNRPDHPVYAMGTNSDQNSAAPDVVLASSPILISQAFVPIAEQVKAGTFKPNDTPYGMKQGVIGFVINPKLAERIPAAARKQIDEMAVKIKSGAFIVPKG